MRILILGATGPVGILLTREALASHHECILYVRSPEKVPSDISSNNAVIVIIGQLTDLESLSKAMEGVEAVCSALGPSVRKGPFHPSGEPLAHAYEGVIQVMRDHGVKRLLALGTASMTAPEDKSDIRFSVLVTGVATFARNAYKDVVAIGETIRKQDDLDWIIVRVPLLTDKGNRDLHAGFIGDGKTHTSLARVGFGVFVVTHLTVEASPWVKKSPMICSV